jgi:hypothetical protein
MVPILVFYKKQNKTCLQTVSAIKILDIFPLMNDYLNQEKTLNKLYNRFPLIENFEKTTA